MKTIKEVLNSGIFIRLSWDEISKKSELMSEAINALKKKRPQDTEDDQQRYVEFYVLKEKPGDSIFTFFPYTGNLNILDIVKKGQVPDANVKDLLYYIKDKLDMESMIMITNRDHKNIMRDVKKKGYSYLAAKRGQGRSKVILKKGKLYEPETDRFIYSTKQIEQQGVKFDGEGFSEMGDLIGESINEGKPLNIALHIAQLFTVNVEKKPKQKKKTPMEVGTMDAFYEKLIASDAIIPIRKIFNSKMSEPKKEYKVQEEIQRGFTRTDPGAVSCRILDFREDKQEFDSYVEHMYKHSSAGAMKKYLYVNGNLCVFWNNINWPDVHIRADRKIIMEVWGIGKINLRNDLEKVSEMMSDVFLNNSRTK